MSKRIKLWLLFVASILVVLSVLLVKSYRENYVSLFDEFSLHSTVLNETRKVFIRLPNNYQPTKAYPLILRTDGNFNLARWDEVLTELAAKAKIDDAILVSIPNLFFTDTRNRDLVPPYARLDVNTEAKPADDHSELGQADRFLAFIETELLPYLEQHYKLTDQRVLSGFSAGGSFVLYTLVTKPQLFNGYFAFSPAAWYDNSEVVRKTQQHIANIGKQKTFLYLSLGSLENPIMINAFDNLTDVFQKNAPDNLRWQFNYNNDADHSHNPYLSVPIALQAYFLKP